jgi:hypothetical protein
MMSMASAQNRAVTNDPGCTCLEHGPPFFDAVHTRSIGVDETEGRYADVTLCTCPRCRRTWLRYQLEYEAFTASGRWCMAPIDAALAARITPETAAAALAAAEWHIYGGSYFDHAGKRGRGRIHWGL